MTDLRLPYQKVNFEQDCETDEVYPLDTDFTIIPFKDFIELQQEALRFYSNHSEQEISAYNVEARKQWEEDRKKLEAPKYPSYSRSGYIYLIGSQEGYYKIGKDKDVSNRYKLIGVNMPFPTEILHTIAVSDMAYTERCLHQRFSTKRRHGEWFALNPEEVASIIQITELEPE